MKVPMLTTDFLDRARKLFADAVGVVADDGAEFTYGEFAARVDRLANAFTELGLTPGDRVALLAPNTHPFLETVFAANRAGMVVVPLNHRLLPADYRFILRDCEARAAVVDRAYAERIESIRGEVPLREAIACGPGEGPGGWRDYESVLAGASSAPPDRADPGEDDDASINYTSGTTGNPKGVVHTHRILHWHALVLIHHLRIREDDTYLWTLPMFHVNGWGHVYAITGVGGTHVCLREFDSGRVFERIARYGVTYLCGAPTVLKRLLAHAGEHGVEGGATVPERPLRVATAGSAPATSTIRAVEEELGWELIHLYGLTETGPLITTSDSMRRIREGDGRAVKARQGAQVLCTDVRVVDEEGNDVPRDDRTMGEVVVRGNQVMDRYLDRPEETAEAFGRRLPGYFHSGDLATVDEHGMIAVKDRSKDLIISGGENISSIEVEDALEAHPGIQKVAVVGIPSEEWGETPLAVVVRARGGEELTPEDVIRFARSRLAGFKCPTAVDFVDDLPETATGKVQKHELRERYWGEREYRVGRQ